MKRKLNNKGEGYIDTAVIVLVVVMLIAMSVKILPVFSTKNTLNQYASELMREAEVRGGIDSEVANKITELNETMKINPTVVWDNSYVAGSSKVQLNDPMSVNVSYTVDIGFFEFGSFPITLTSKATGKSEVYWK